VLRYASEGGALVVCGRGAVAPLIDAHCELELPKRPPLWYPYVFSDPAYAQRIGVRM
jgi:hypothetical protein